MKHIKQYFIRNLVPFTALCKSNANKIQCITVFVLAKFRVNVRAMSHDCLHMNEIKRNKINESFTASKKTLTTNDNLLKISLSAS